MCIYCDNIVSWQWLGGVFPNLIFYAGIYFMGLQQLMMITATLWCRQLPQLVVVSQRCARVAAVLRHNVLQCCTDVGCDDDGRVCVCVCVFACVSGVVSCYSSCFRKSMGWPNYAVRTPLKSHSNISEVLIHILIILRSTHDMIRCPMASYVGS